MQVRVSRLCVDDNLIQRLCRWHCAVGSHTPQKVQGHRPQPFGMLFLRRKAEENRAMLSESQLIYERQKLYALMHEHPEWSLRTYARTLKHDLKWVRTWAKRFKAVVAPTLEMFRSQPRKPKHSPKQLADTLKDAICDLRESLSERFNRAAGAETIQYFLKAQVEALPCARSIYKVLHERGYVQIRRKPARFPLELPAPMEEFEMDFGEIYLGPVEGVFEFFLVVDRGTSRVIYLEASHGYRAESALEAVVRLFDKQGLPKRLRFDRDPRLWGSWTRDSYPSLLVRMLRVLGVEPIVCPPRRPDMKPFVERSVKTLKFEWLARYSPPTYADALALLDPFIPYHNAQRPHQGRACNNEIPDIAFPALPTLPILPQAVQPNRWLQAEHHRIYRRRVNANGSIQVDTHSYYLGQDYAGLAVLAQVDAEKAHLLVIGDGKLLKTFPLMGLLPNEMPLVDFVERLKTEARFVEQYRRIHWEQTGEFV